MYYQAEMKGEKRSLYEFSAPDFPESFEAEGSGGWNETPFTNADRFENWGGKWDPRVTNISRFSKPKTQKKPSNNVSVSPISENRRLSGARAQQQQTQQQMQVRTQAPAPRPRPRPQALTQVSYNATFGSLGGKSGSGGNFSSPASNYNPRFLFGAQEECGNTSASKQTLQESNGELELPQAQFLAYSQPNRSLSDVSTVQSAGRVDKNEQSVTQEKNWYNDVYYSHMLMDFEVQYVLKQLRGCW